MKNLFKVLLLSAIMFIATAGNSQIITLTVTTWGNNSVDSLSQGFETSRIGRIYTVSGGSAFYYDDPRESRQYVTVTQSVAEIAALTGSVDNIPQSLSKRIVLKFDATGGKTAGTYNLVQLNGESFTLPDNARVMRGWYETQTTFTSATDAATISLGIATDDVAGLKAAIAISNGANPYDAGLGELIQTGTVANASEKTTAATRTIDAVVATESLTAGVLVVVLDYVVLE